MTKGYEHAVVLGASISGLLAARVLSERFRAVTIVERDRLLGAAEPRKGVPQGHHVHGLLLRGAGIVEELFPGISSALQADGAQNIDLSADWKWFHFGAYKPRFPSGITSMVQSRPLLEMHIRRRAQALPNVQTRDEHDVVELIGSPRANAITGVTIRCRKSNVQSQLEADLVVDAMGRGSRAPGWLSALGFERPEEETIRIDVHYTSRLYRRRPTDMTDAKMVFVYPSPPRERRLGSITPIEGDRWLVSLCGWLGDGAPSDEEGFLEFTRGLPTQDVYNVLRGLEPLSEIFVHKFPSNQRRRYERLKRLPDGFIAIGDAVCSVNPIYGQGMTNIALGAAILRKTLEQDQKALPRRYFQQLGRAIEVPWALSVSEDLRYPEIIGDRSRVLRFLHWYADRLHGVASQDTEVHRTFLKVMNMTRPPTDLFRPTVAWRVLTANS